MLNINIFIYKKITQKVAQVYPKQARDRANIKNQIVLTKSPPDWQPGT